MANIAPNSTVILLHGVPLAPDYEMSLYFGAHTTDASAKASCLQRQEGVMMAQALRLPSGSNATFSAITYQRVGRNRIRVEAVADWLYNCNYMMFKNTNFGNKWFYAFVTAVEYINNSVSEITYELDVIQTWFYDYMPQACFIERQHTVSDLPYEHLVKENLDFDPEYLCNSTYSRTYNLAAGSQAYVGSEFMGMRMCCITADLPNDVEEPTGLRRFGGIYSGLYVVASYGPAPGTGAVILSDNSSEPITDSDDNPYSFQQFIDTLVDEGHEDSIVSIFQFPDFADPTKSDIEIVLEPATSILGFTPKNTKLLSYPYCYLEVFNGNNQAVKYRYEDFLRKLDQSDNHLTRTSPTFLLKGSILSSPAAMSVPKYYLGKEENSQYAVLQEDFPICSWTGDVYAAYMAANQYKMAANVATSAIGGAVGGAVTGGPIGAIGGGLSGVASSIGNILASQFDMENMPTPIHGASNNSSIHIVTGNCKFDYISKCIKPQWAKIIDDYFTRYGYAIHDVAIPNEAARHYFTYVKTVGMSMYADMPADDAAKIAAIYDNGITFWNCVQDTAHIGDYSMDNRAGV